METVAANLGSMLMPFGNPQNLFLYEEYHFSMAEFLQLMLPYTVLSLVLILALTVLFCGSRSGAESGKTGDSGNSGTFGKNEACGKVGDFGRTKEAGVQELQVKRGKFFFFLLLFICCLLSVGGLLPSSALLVIVLAAVLIRECGLLPSVDYSLLLTFLFFFVFIGNIGNVAAVRSFLGEIVKGREVVTSILASQIVSNVPAAVLLAGFTENGRALVIGTNFGGLGTLIASMASLITYKFFAEQYRWQRLAYIVRFTAVNVLMLVLLLFAYVIF
jgi:Na+/H+ antiporter NhaD/arsenite permease-like protein